MLFCAQKVFWHLFHAGYSNKHGLLSSVVLAVGGYGSPLLCIYISTDIIVIDHPSAARNSAGTYIYGIHDSGRIPGWYDDGEKSRGSILSR